MNNQEFAAFRPINVSATYNPDGWCTSLSVNGLNPDEVADMIRVLVKPRPPRPKADPAETVVMPLRTSTPLTTYTFQ